MIRPFIMFELKKTVALVGMMGSGKSAVGKVIASVINVPFVDADVEIERAAKLSIPEIFERHGEKFFREKEDQVIKRLLQAVPCILATGGGAFVNKKIRKSIDRHGVSVWLNADLTTLWNRVKHKKTRPLLRTNNPKETLKDIYIFKGFFGINCLQKWPGFFIFYTVPKGCKISI